MMKKKEVIVVSGINFFEGGPLSIMKDALNSLSTKYADKYKIIALVHRKNVYEIENIEFVEFPKSRTSWFFRLYYEYVYFKKFSKKIKPTYWISMHDITPNVISKHQFVYCHNPAPFFNPKKSDIKYSFNTFLFSKLYKYLYRINIYKNTSIIVQQDWLRNEFQKKWKLKNIIVAHPENEHQKSNTVTKEKAKESMKSLIYPGFPRSFKNFEIICEAFKQLEPAYQKKLKIYLTLDEGLNKYARDVVLKYKKHANIVFTGLLKREEVFEYYNSVDGLVFPSRLETWGLPLSEFKSYNKPIIAARLPYAFETIGNYDKAAYFDPNNSEELSKLFKNFIDNILDFEQVKREESSQTIVKGWESLFAEIIQ